jgi:hypothetical protein
MTTALSILTKSRRNRVKGLRHLAYSVVVCVLMGLAPADQGFAQAPKGTVVAVVQPASATGPAGVRALTARKPVFQGDRINTGPAGEVHIRFRDGTLLVVGPNSSLVIDRFAIAEGPTAQQGRISFTRGTFRIVGSDRAKQAYSLRTPKGIVAIGGTSGSGGEPRIITPAELAQLQNDCAVVFRKPAKYLPDTIAVCRLLASL